MKPHEMWAIIDDASDYANTMMTEAVPSHGEWRAQMLAINTVIAQALVNIDESLVQGLKRIPR